MFVHDCFENYICYLNVFGFVRTSETPCGLRLRPQLMMKTEQQQDDI